jgi:hypothetical protein
LKAGHAAYVAVSERNNDSRITALQYLGGGIVTRLWRPAQAKKMQLAMRRDSQNKASCTVKLMATNGNDCPLCLACL